MIGMLLTKPLLIGAAVVTVALGAALAVQSVRLSSAKSDLAEARSEVASVRLQHQTEVAKAAELTRAAEAAARQEEQRRAVAIAQVSTAAEARLRTVRLDAAGARDAADRLRGRVADLVADLADASATPRDPDAAAAGSTTDGAARVLADMLSRIDAAAGIYAAAADERGGAGDACERTYDSLRATK